MKKDCEIIRYVYSRLPFKGGYFRFKRSSCDYSSLSSDFPAAAYVSESSQSFLVKYTLLDDKITIWKDKHGNIIVRILRTSNKQTKINF